MLLRTIVHNIYSILLDRRMMFYNVFNMQNQTFETYCCVFIRMRNFSMSSSVYSQNGYTVHVSFPFMR